MIDEPTPLDVSVAANEEFARDLAERARTDGVELVAPGGLLTGLTKTVLETALAVEMEDRSGQHQGCGRPVRPRRGEPDLGDHLEVDALQDLSVAFGCDAGAAAARPCRSCEVAGGGRACRSRLLGAGSFERRRQPAAGGARVCGRFMFAVGERLFALAAGQPAGRPSRVGAGVLSTTCTCRSAPPLLSAPTHANAPHSVERGSC